MTTPPRTRGRRAGLMFGLAAVAVLAAAGADWGRLARARRVLVGFDARADLAYHNPLTGPARLDRLRAFAGGVLPFDRLDAARFEAPRVTDADAPAFVDALAASGPPRELALGGHSLSEVGLSELARLETVERLALGRPVLHGPAALHGGAGGLAAVAAFWRPRKDRWLAALPRLEVLDLTYSDGGDPTVPALLGCRSLKEVRCEFSKMTDAGLLELAAHPGLERVDVPRGKVTRAGAWAFRLARPDVVVTGLATPPKELAEADLDAYRRARDAAERRTRPGS